MQNKTLTFPATPPQKQAARFWSDNKTQKIAYGGAKGGGKSFLGANLIFGDALTYNGIHNFIARSKLNDLRRFTIPTIYEVFDKWGLDHEKYIKWNGQDSYFKLHNGSRVYMIDCKYQPSDPLFERFGSVQMTRGWIEEAGEVSYDAADNLRLTVGRWKNNEYNLLGKILYTLNPKKNWIYRDIYKPWKDDELPEDTKFIQAFVWDNPFIPKSYVKSLKQTKNKTRYQRLYKGNWDYDDDPSVLVEYDALIDSFRNDHILPDTNNRYITADIAMQGSDLFIVGVWYGWVLAEVIVKEKSGGKEIIDIINDARRRHSIRQSHVVYDNDGLGSFIGGSGGFLPGALQFNNGSRSLKFNGEDENYEHLKAQCYYHLADRINNGEIWLRALNGSRYYEHTIEELEQIKSIDNDVDGKIRLIKKADVREAIGRSPDISDMIAMREFFELDYSTLPEML